MENYSISNSRAAEDNDLISKPFSLSVYIFNKNGSLIQSSPSNRILPVYTTLCKVNSRRRVV